VDRFVQLEDSAGDLPLAVVATSDDQFLPSSSVTTAATLTE
jgi:hypothetical protein